jgi:hypothetical protein
MPAHSLTLARLTVEQRAELERRLWDRQDKICYLCEKSIDLDLQADSLDIDHIIPVTASGKDEENNFALTHASCKRASLTPGGGTNHAVSAPPCAIDMRAFRRRRAHRQRNRQHPRQARHPPRLRGAIVSPAWLPAFEVASTTPSSTRTSQQ